MTKSLFTALIISMMLVVIVAPVLGDNIIDLPESGTDYSNMRCQGDIVSIGATVDEVASKCGEPVARGQIPNRTYDVWVYQSDGGNEVNYLGFRNRRLQRIYSVNCVTHDPYCP